MESHAEEIIKIIHQQKKRKQLQNNDINKGYAEIFYNTVIFERTELCHKKFSMLTPAFLTSLENDTELEYSTQNKPEFIYVNETMDINMTFSLVENEQLQTDIFKMQKQMQQDIKQMYPNIMLTEQDILNTKDDVSIAYFCFPLKIEEETLMEVVFLFLVENQWVVGTFHCPDTQKKRLERYCKADAFVYTTESMLSEVGIFLFVGLCFFLNNEKHRNFLVI